MKDNFHIEKSINETETGYCSVHRLLSELESGATNRGTF